MHRSPRTPAPIACAFGLGVALVSGLTVQPSPPSEPRAGPLSVPAFRGPHRSPSTSSNLSAARALGHVRLSFIPNRGQISGPVDYYVQGSATSVYFTPSGLTYVLSGLATKPTHDLSALNQGAPPEEKRWVVKLHFGSGHRPVRPVGEGKLPGVVSYFTGPRTHWRTEIPTFRRIVYRDLWPGIDLAYSGSATGLEYRFLVHPGATPRHISMAYRGASSVKVAREHLRVSTPVQTFAEANLVAYQNEKGRRVPVSASYAQDASAQGGQSWGFDIQTYDRSRTLVIDPIVFIRAGYIGGADLDIASGIAVDRSGNAYVAGTTFSDQSTFPATVGPDLTLNGIYDAFVAKIDASGTHLDYAGYIGGAQGEGGSGVAVDGSGNAYVTGFTYSDQGTFPVATGPDLTYHGGRGDAFVARVDASGTHLDYAGYIGGARGEGGSGITVDGSGNAYVTGFTESRQSTFPVGRGPDLTYNGALDAFSAKVDASGTHLDYAGYIGGAADDSGVSVAVDRFGNAYVTGVTYSGRGTFPVATGPDLTYHGAHDAFVAKVDASGTHLDYAGYIGGAGFDVGSGVAVDGSGNAYVTGSTDSGQATFPVTVGADLTFNGDLDAFVAKVGRCTITGTPGPDALKGTAGDDVICGGGGDDVLIGGRGNDVLYGGRGNDVLVPGPGRNAVEGGSGRNTVSFWSLSGGPVRVHLDAFPGTAVGGGTRDTLRGIRDVTGTKFRDSIYGGTRANRLRGLGGNDVLHGLGGNDTLDGGPNGRAGDVLYGGRGTDRCIRGEHDHSCER